MKKIMCAYDFSDAAENGLKHACALAHHFNSALSIVYIYNIPIPVTEFGYIDVGDEVIKTKALKDLEEIKSQIKVKYENIKEINLLIETGLVSYKLNKLAKNTQCDLLVMGIDDDANFIKEHLLGSMAIDEARESKIPVLIVPKSSECAKINTIAFASDYTLSDEKSTALIKVKYYSSLFNAPLSVIHVLAPEHKLNTEEAVKDKLIEEKLEHADHKTFYMYEKNAADGIIHFVKNHPIDLLIVEPNKQTFFNSLFHKSATKALAFHLNKPILAIHGD